MVESGKIGLEGISQVCVVVKDLQKSMERYWSILGIGPWQVYTFEPPHHTDTQVRGRPTFYRMQLALAQVDSMMWELIEPLEGESIYAEFLREKGEGLHHVISTTGDFDQAITSFQRQGINVLQSGRWHSVKYAYMDTEEMLGAIMELVHTPEEFIFPPPETTWPPSDSTSR